MSVYVTVGDDHDAPYSQFKLPDRVDVDIEHDPEWALEECARHYYSDCDGWEAAWPLTFHLRESIDGPVLASGTVALDFEPTFYLTT